MNARLDYKELAPDAYQALWSLEKLVRASGLDRALLNLVYLRVSQINGCAFCVDMHSKDLRAAGESDERLACLTVWRESPIFTARERASLAWAEAVTELGREHVPDAVYAEARREMDERHLIWLTLAVSTVNTWNRMAIAFRSVPGRYKARAAVDR
ncbi:MAG TPA: carboxymuconolactone decarboxylase family protein [Polyangia bacterium]|nr:carboxymuconolactone decarboxylase family protein [Polyangia bacterium]